MALNMPSRELVGLLADVYPFASDDAEDTTWHRVVLRWDGSRLHACAGIPTRYAWTSWGPNDVDQPELPLNVSADADDSWELAITPEDAKELATKFKVAVKDGEAPLAVTGSHDAVTVRRDTDTGYVALTGSALARPWDSNAPDIPELIAGVADQAKNAQPRKAAAYMGPWLADFGNHKVVRQRGPLLLHFGTDATYVEIGRWFRGAVVQDRAEGNPHA